MGRIGIETGSLSRPCWVGSRPTPVGYDPHISADKWGTDPGFGVFVATAPAMADSTFGMEGGDSISSVGEVESSRIPNLHSRGNYHLLLTFFESCIKIEENGIKCV